MTLGIVVIGRNEAAHLGKCLAALPDVPTIYADSDSTDDSVAVARGAGVETVFLTTPPATTAARGRNAGLARLLDRAPDTDLVHMVDGDTILDPTWIDIAQTALLADPKLAAVFGQLRERHPEASLYNRLCNREWQVPPGRVSACGGIALFRVAAIQSVGGYADDVMAGEEPDLCLRMRAQGWEIEALAAPMGTHDAGLLRFGQWWRRARRAGHAYAEHVARHGQNSDPNWRRQLVSILIWGGGFPIVTLMIGIFVPKLLILPLFLWCLQTLRIFAKERRSGARPSDAFGYAITTMIAKVAQLQGVVDFASRRAIRKIFGPSTR
jgi:GT2 family glycosyltransferase